MRQKRVRVEKKCCMYDDFGNLSFVLPPKVDTSDGVSETELSELCYQYKYDYRNRLFEKKIPGKGKESIIYNLRDEAIATQDANLEENDQWLFTRYDAFGRVEYTGIVNNALDRATLQAVANDRDQYRELVEGLDDIVELGGDLVFEQTPTPENPNSRIEILTINYYDNYSFTDIVPPSDPLELFEQELKTNVTSYPTGSKVRVLGTNDWITTVTFYDYKARPIYTYSQNDYLSTTDIAISELDFTGRVLRTKTTHTKGENDPIVTIDRFTYDHVGRLLTQTQQINDSERKERIAENTYDELGLLTDKKVGGSALGGLALQDVEYHYNVRGWMTGINDPTNLGNKLFGFAIGYNTPSIDGATALFNGNISETVWNTADTNTQSNYVYTYDALNRITAATSDSGNYNLSGVTYDKVGNIQTLNRIGYKDSFGEIDKLSYQYDAGNKLLSVTDTANALLKEAGFNDGNIAGDDYDYDLNGNMIIDNNKQISEITYNHLNLPTFIQTSQGRIRYKYDATGIKLEKKVYKNNALSNILSYAGNYVYEHINPIKGIGATKARLSFFNTPEGYVEPEYGDEKITIFGFDYIYQYKDHLGNIRLSYSDSNGDGSIDYLTNNATVDGDGDGDNVNEIREVKNYYPFGMLQNRPGGNVVNGRRHNYGFNGAEENDGLGLNILEMDWRHYDPAIARWTGIDPIAHWSMSPYNAFDNNPVFWADPSGADSIYNFNTQQYVINGKEVSQAEAIAYAQNGGNADGSNNNNVDNSNSKENQEGGSDLFSSENNMMNITDPEENIRKYEENDKTIIQNSMILDVLGNFTTTGQLRASIESVALEWEKSLRIVVPQQERDELFRELETAFLTLGVTITTLDPRVKVAAGIIATPLMIEATYLDFENRFILGPQIKRDSPRYHAENIDITAPHIGGAFSGGGAGGSY